MVDILVIPIFSAFYMHTILENITIPFDTYTIAIFLAAYRNTCPVKLPDWND